ncbi:hypothetical protein WMY93_006193 [Mugilogobius chulae]|uniref:C2H2-type domain-containing protein n=1 Tax=Mugilogobius chulae TaxID=88201 RepID=A0AAW0PJ11_9GOBI
MPAAADLHSQIASIVEVLANAAVAEICKAVEDGYAVVNLEMSRSQKENECLKRRVRLLELQVSRYRAEQRLKAPEATGAGRLFPASGSCSTATEETLRAPVFTTDPDPDQEVVTTTKTEPAEPEEDNDIIIVKVESSISHEDTSNTKNTSSSSLEQTREIRAQSSSQTEVSGSQNLTDKPLENVTFSHCDKTSNYDLNATQMPSSFNASANETVGTFCGVTTSFNTSNLATNDQQTSNSQPNVDITNLSFNILNQSCLNKPTLPQNGLGIKPFKCSKCPMRFFLEADLTHHLKNHLRRKFNCALCGKGFVCKSQLEVHKNVHTGARPYSCSMCDSWFSHPSNLQRHIKKKHLLSAPGGSG